MTLESFEAHRADLFAEAAKRPIPTRTWRTPDGRWWAPGDVLHAWGGTRPSDRWAHVQLDELIAAKLIEVSHIELPSPLRVHSPDDPAWQFVASLGSAHDTEPDAHIGRADLIVTFDDGGPGLLVEFGTCLPAKFVLNVASPMICDWMIVPYGCQYAFVFRPLSIPLFRMPEPEEIT